MAEESSLPWWPRLKDSEQTSESGIAHCTPHTRCDRQTVSCTCCGPVSTWAPRHAGVPAESEPAVRSSPCSRHRCLPRLRRQRSGTACERHGCITVREWDPSRSSTVAAPGVVPYISRAGAPSGSAGESGHAQDAGGAAGQACRGGPGAPGRRCHAPRGHCRCCRARPCTTASPEPGSCANPRCGACGCAGDGAEACGCA